jgi:hypothetical protein
VAGSATTRVTVTLTFVGKLKGRFTFHVSSSVVDPSDPVITGAIALIEALTRGKAVHIEISLQAATVGSVSTGVAYVNEDKAFFRFKDNHGIGHNYRIMSPESSILLTNTETVDLTNTFVVAYTGAVTTNARGRGGNLVNTIVSAYRKENRKLIKGGSQFS